MNRIRVFVQRKYNDDNNGWVDYDWMFPVRDLDEFIDELNSHGDSIWRIKYLHIITDDDFTNHKVYTIPQEQVIFYP